MTSCLYCCKSIPSEKGIYSERKEFAPEQILSFKSRPLFKREIDPVDCKGLVQKDPKRDQRVDDILASLPANDKAAFLLLSLSVTS